MTVPKPALAPADSSLFGQGCAPKAARAHGTDDLPSILAMSLWPWTDIVETAMGGMGDVVRLTAENTVTNLRRLIVPTSPLEIAMEDALLASDALAQDLDRRGFFQPAVREEARVALNALTWWLGSAKPAEQTKEIGLGW
ncbi:hypothetical protein [Methylobacterium pseudosasicola]|nr:hypothetical protein [Methylobacterium pseudosasicola]